LALLLVALPLLRAVPVPAAEAAVSSGVAGSSPLYSRMRTSGKLTVLLKVTVTVLAPAAAAAMFLA
jgi:hypothetical protein